jgi:hypothetical protein
MLKVASWRTVDGMLTQGEFENRRMTRSRRGNEAEIVSPAEVRLLTSAATPCERTLLADPSTGSAQRVIQRYTHFGRVDTRPVLCSLAANFCHGSA